MSIGFAVFVLFRSDIIFFISGSPPLSIEIDANRSCKGFASLKAPTDKIDKNGRISIIFSFCPERICGKTPTKNMAEIPKGSMNNLGISGNTTVLITDFL